MAGAEVFKVAVSMLARAVEEALAANGLSKDALTWLVPHQANIRIIQATARKIGLPMERTIVTVADHGNTSSASVPLALDVGVRDGRIKRGDLLLLEAFGGGFTWGSALIRYLVGLQLACAPNRAFRGRVSREACSISSSSARGGAAAQKTPRLRGVFSGSAAGEIRRSNLLRD